MKSIITGGAGFLGCHLAEYLVKLNQQFDTHARLLHLFGSSISQKLRTSIN